MEFSIINIFISIGCLPSAHMLYGVYKLKYVQNLQNHWWLIQDLKNIEHCMQCISNSIAAFLLFNSQTCWSRNLKIFFLTSCERWKRRCCSNPTAQYNYKYRDKYKPQTNTNTKLLTKINTNRNANRNTIKIYQWKLQIQM